MTGLEALSLQGLPIDELLLTRESEDQLADLAGNAMSTTVVGASIMAALTVGKGLLKKGSDTSTYEEQKACGDAARGTTEAAEAWAVATARAARTRSISRTIGRLAARWRCGSRCAIAAPGGSRYFTVSPAGARPCPAIGLWRAAANHGRLFHRPFPGSVMS